MLTTGSKDDHSSDYKGLAQIIYLLQALAFLFGGITFFIAVFLNYANKKHVEGTWLESHYNWQIETFWVALFLLAIGTLTLPFYFGFVVLIAAIIWVINRIVSGWVALNKSAVIKQRTKLPFI